MFHEKHHRTFFKSITWLIVGFLITYSILVLVGDDSYNALWHAFLIQIIKFIFFYIHERVWNKSNFGQELKIKK